MIEGIEILSQKEIMTAPGWLWWAVIIGGIAVWLAVCVLIHWITDDDGIGCMSGGVVLVLYALIMTAMFGATVPTGRYRYEATIDETVNFTELYERYDVVEQRDKIYILEDKDLTE